MHNRHVFALSLIAAAMVAGCTAVPGTGGTDGEETQQRFRITQEDGLTLSFQSAQSSYFEDGQITLDFSAQNTGQSEATNIKAKLFGASFLATKTITSDLSRTTLEGVDREAQQPGGITTATVTMNNPVDLRQGETRSFPAGIRVAYDYATSSSAAFRVVPRTDFEGGSELVTTDNTAGPVKANIQVQSPKPVSTPASGSSMVTASIPIQIRNVGGGRVVDSSNPLSGNRGDVKMTVSFPLAAQQQNPAASIEKCGASQGNTASTSFPRGENQRRIVCTAKISPDVFDTQLTIEADLEYTYFETSETSFQIEGLQGDQRP